MSVPIVETSLHYFVIYCSKLGQKEGTEHEKILFFYPPTINIGEQTNSVGISEAYVLFTKQFSPDQPCEFIHTKKSTLALLHPEEDIWMVLSVYNPTGITGKDNKREYIEDEVDDIILMKTIQQIYQTWQTFNGSIMSLASKTSYDNVRKRLESFVKPYIQQIQFDQLDLFTSLDGIKFLPLNKNVYLTIFGYINSVDLHFQSTLSSFRFGLVLYKDNLILSSLEQNETRILYNYLINMVKVGPDINSSNSMIVKNNSNNIPIWQTKGVRTGFMIQKDSLPMVWLGGKPQAMIVYEQKDTFLLFLIDPSDLPQLPFEDLSASLVQNFEFVNLTLEQHYAKKANFDEQYKYIYFNQMNLAIRSPIKPKGPELNKETMKLLNEIHADFEGGLSSEIIVKTQQDRWIVAKKIDFREFYIMFDNKNSSILEINEEVKNATTKFFKFLFTD
ncbi:hypothetical protein ACTFIR_001637 [Dictyostelium discoideum]